MAQRSGRLLGLGTSVAIAALRSSLSRKLNIGDCPPQTTMASYVVGIEVGQLACREQRGGVLGAQIAEAEDVFGGVADSVAPVAHAVILDGAALGAGHVTS